MITLPSLSQLDRDAPRIWLATALADKRGGFERLAQLAQSVLGQEPTPGSNSFHHTSPRAGARLVFDGLVTEVALTKRFESGEGTVRVVIALHKCCGLFHQAITLALWQLHQRASIHVAWHWTMSFRVILHDIGTDALSLGCCEQAFSEGANRELSKTAWSFSPLKTHGLFLSPPYGTELSEEVPAVSLIDDAKCNLCPRPFKRLSAAA